jgi:hypothetical protein
MYYLNCYPNCYLSFHPKAEVLPRRACFPFLLAVGSMVSTVRPQERSEPVAVRYWCRPALYQLRLLRHGYKQ